MPFLNVVDPAFDFTAPEVLAAQDAGWYAESPLGPLVLCYAEVQELLRDRRLDHGGDSYLRRNGITSGPIHDGRARRTGGRRPQRLCGRADPGIRPRT